MKEVFPIIPTNNNWGLWIMLSLAVLMFGVALMFTYLASTLGKASFEVSPEGLRLRGDMYGRMVPVQQLCVDQARIINLLEDTEHQLKSRTMGTALPGHQAGWFRLRNGEKSLVYLTDHTRVVYLPTRAGYSIMLSTPQPEAMLASLRRLS